MIYYGMFTTEGNQKVAAIVEFAKTNGAEWENVLPMLKNLALSNPMYREANDTVVREMVYDACSFTSDFYV